MSIKTRVGNIVKIKNQDKKKTANTEYQAVLLKDSNAIINFLFTDVEMNVARHRSLKNPEDKLEQSFASKILD